MNVDNDQREDFVKQTRNERNTEEVNGCNDNIKAVDNQRENFTKEKCEANHSEFERRDNFRITRDVNGI